MTAPSASALEYPISKTDDQWREQLTDRQYVIMRRGGTEMAFTGQYVNKIEDGIYVCRGCGHELFSTAEQFHSGSGWPSFYHEVEGANVELLQDYSMGMQRTEARCPRCGSHLGHVFYDEGFGNPTNTRYCINSASLILRPEDAQN